MELKHIVFSLLVLAVASAVAQENGNEVEARARVELVQKTATLTLNNAEQVIASVEAQINNNLNKAQIQALINILKEQKVKLLQLKEQLLQVDAFLDSLQGIIPPWLYALLKQIIAQLLERIETLCKKIEALLARLDCLFKKACLKEKIAEITKKYISLQKELGDLKKECDAAKFDKKCIARYQALKKEFQTLRTEITLCIEQLKKISNCFKSKLEYTSVLNQLLNLLAKVDASISTIQDCLKKMFAIKIKLLHIKYGSLVISLTELKKKVENAQSKEDLQGILSAIQGIQNEANLLKEEVKLVIQCLTKAIRCMKRADYLDCLNKLTALSNNLENFCKTIRECIVKIEKQLTAICLQMDIKKKTKRIELLKKHYNELFQGFSLNCNFLLDLLKKLRDLERELEACKKELEKLNARLEQLKGCPEYDEIKESLESLKKSLYLFCDQLKAAIEFIKNLIVSNNCQKPTIGPTTSIPIQRGK